MKHAILLLSSYGADYLNKNIEQFNNDPDIDIYIHIDDKSYNEKDQIILSENIKYCEHLYNCPRFSFELCDVMFSLLEISYQTNKYDYYHFFSDHCFIHTTIDNFKYFFENCNSYSYMCYWEHHFWIRPWKYEAMLLKYKGSQWNSFHKNIVYNIIKNKDKFNEYVNNFKNETIQIVEAACDEMILQNLILIDIFHEDFDEINKHIKNDNLRKIMWALGRGDYYLKSKIHEYDIKDIRNNSLIIRKIDYKNEDSWQFLKFLKDIDGFEYNKKYQIWCLTHKDNSEEYELVETPNLKILNLNDNLPGLAYNKLNPYFSEFAGLYYIWKNNYKSDIIGFCHYNRHFNNIDLNKINNDQVQVWEYTAKNYYSPYNMKDNNFLKYCMLHETPSYILYSFCKIIAKHKNKSILEVLNDLTNNNIISQHAGRTMFICKWEIFDKIMTIFENFIFDVFPNFSIENIHNIFETSNKIFLEEDDLGIINISDTNFKNFYWKIYNGEKIFNSRIFGYYAENFIGLIICYFFNTFEIDANLYVNIDDIDINKNDLRKFILYYYIKNLNKGYKFIRFYSKKDNEINIGEYDRHKFERLEIIPSQWAEDYKNHKRTIKNDNYDEKNLFIKWDKEKNKFIDD